MKKDINQILLVEDDQVDSMTVRRALRDLKDGHGLTVKSNGEEALAYLREPGTVPPGLILLDINMPRMNGIEFLRIIKQDERLKKIPVVVLTTSNDEQDRMHSFNLGVAGYMLKPVIYDNFVEVMKTILLYWNTSQQPD